MKPQIDTKVISKLDELMSIVAADPPTDSNSESFSFTITRDKGGITYAQTVADDVGNSTNIAQRVVTPVATATPAAATPVTPIATADLPVTPDKPAK